MKRYLLITLLSFLFIPIKAQDKTMSFEVNGLKVIFRPTQKETVSIRMYYRGGLMNYNYKQAGIENLSLSAAATCGTKNYSVNDYQELADEYGIEITGSSQEDYGTIGMDCINKYFDQGWKLFSDAVVNPVFDPGEFQKTKDKIRTGIDARQSDPETRVAQMSASAMFEGTPYSIDPMGTEETIKGFTADSVKNYYLDKLLNKNSMFLVVAGKITREDLEKKIAESFAALIAKPYTPAVYVQKPLVGEHLLMEQRPIATNYMSCIMNAPVRNSPDYYAFVLAINALSSNLHYEIRIKQGLSYDPGATLKIQQMPYTSMYVSTTQPKKAFQAIVNVYTAVRSGKGYGPDFLAGIKKDHRSRYYRHQESSNSIVTDLGEAEVLGGYLLEENELAGINKVTLADINLVLNKYLKGAIWIYLGDEEAGKATFQ